MERTIEELKTEIEEKCDEYVYLNRADLLKDVEPLMLDIQSFIMQFIQTNDIGVESDIKASMNTDMLSILNDIAKALENNDCVLLYDALECGLTDYLKLFVSEDDDEQEHI